VKTVMQKECAYCGDSMGEIDGLGQTGTTHGICPICVVIERLKMAQSLVKDQHLSWEEAMKKAEVPSDMQFALSHAALEVMSES
jgi:hypothetical protein